MRATSRVVLSSSDPHAPSPEGHNLRNFLLTIQENLSIFAEENFRERLKGNPFVDSLAATARGPDAKQLSQDIEFSGADNPLVKNLIVMRNNHFAHRSARDAISPQDLNLKYPLTKEDGPDSAERRSRNPKSLQRTV